MAPVITGRPSVVGGIGPESTIDCYRALIALKREEQADALILGGTELPLLLRGCEVPGLPFIDTARIHVAAAVARLLDVSDFRDPADPDHAGGVAPA
jgi:aspartate/glutamate racemase